MKTALNHFRLVPVALDGCVPAKSQGTGMEFAPRGGSVPAAIVLAALIAVVATFLPKRAAADPLSPATAIYGIGTDNNIYSFDPTTGLATGTTSTAALSLTGNEANAFALDVARTQVYFLGTDKNLYAWDRPTGWLGQVASAGDLGLTTAPIPKVATFYADRFWFIEAGDNLLKSALITFGTSGTTSGVPIAATIQSPITISGVPGTVNTTGPVLTPGFTNPHDIAFNPITQMLYGTERDGSFFQLDASTAVLTGTVGYTQLYASVGANSVQLAYDQDYNTLYGVSFADGQWYTLDTVLGGSATAIPGAQTDIVTNPELRMADLAGGLAVVPEPGSMAIAGSGILFAGLLCHRSRQRRRGRGASLTDQG